MILQKMPIRKMPIGNMKDEVLLDSLKAFVREERAALARILEHLQEVESRKLHLELAFSSMFSFCTEYLGYSEKEAVIRIQAMRLAKAVPEIKTKIQSGSISLTVAANVQAYIVRENKILKESKQEPIAAPKIKQIIDAVSNQSVKSSEKILVNYFPSHKELPFERAKPISLTVMRVEMNLSMETYEMLKAIQNLRSHAIPTNEFEPLIRGLCELGIKKWHPLKKLQTGPAELALKH